jgi:hypothetical protein
MQSAFERPILSKGEIGYIESSFTTRISTRRILAHLFQGSRAYRDSLYASSVLWIKEDEVLRSEADKESDKRVCILRVSNESRGCNLSDLCNKMAMCCLKNLTEFHVQTLSFIDKPHALIKRHGR